MMSTRIYLPSDTTARALGADRLARQIETLAEQQGVELEIVRTGTRGLYWLEPLIEVDTDKGRVGYGPVTPEDLESLFAAGFWQGEVEHPLALGLVEQIPYLARQQRLTFARARHHRPPVTG